MILEYLIEFHLQDCINILSELDNLGYFNIKIDFIKLFETYPDVGDKVLCNPVKYLQACNKDIIKAQQIILEKEEYKSVLSKLTYSSLKRNVHARFFGLPVCPELHRTVFPKNVDMGCFLKVSGTVVRVTQTKMLEYQRKYVCMKCKYENCVEADFENRYILKAPSKCGNMEIRCRCSTFTQINLVSREHCRDYQEIKIQEQVNKLSIGTIPGSMWVVLEDDLVDCCKPGDDVVICGTVRRRWRPSVQNKRSEVELVMQANYVEVSNAQRSEVIATAPDVKDCFNEYWSKFEACPLKGRDQILSSVCPQVYGLHLVKLAVMLTVITGSNHELEDECNKSTHDEKYSMHVRGQCHLLLVGDPGTGKSQLLRASAELTPRSVFTSGAGSTRAGLTCAALKEDGEWQLEAGALVLSDGGVCCIDEISHLREHDRTAIHEAMEQQTISIAKAGIVCKLNTRCAVIAACNPKGHYQTDEPLSSNVSLGTPLLSRFDLIFILLDSKNSSWDNLVSSYILFGGSKAIESKTRWSIEKLQMYISLVGPRRTEMSKSANAIIQSYYMMQRKSNNRDPSRTTVRMLDSLVRLSQAHCRLMFRTTILPVDAIMAVSLMDLSMQDCTLDDTMDALHSAFQKYPDFEYLRTANKVLKRLNLHHIWKEELLYYAKLLRVDYKTLESEVEKGNPQLFSKYDDVMDDNMPLSASLVTSSYFNRNENKPVNPDTKLLNKENINSDGDKDQRCIVKDRLAATLKKHAGLNKCESKLPIVQKKVTQKRKRREVTVNTNSVKKKILKKSNNRGKINIDHSSESDGDFNDTTSMLKAVPSVNDVFKDLEIDLKMDNSIHENVENGKDDSNDKIKTEDVISAKVDSCNSHKLGDEIQPISKTLNFLKQFEFVKKHESNKPHVENDTNNSNVIIKSPNVKKESNKSISNEIFEKPSSGSSSQISIFESTDCDIDLDI
ncbi:unnamed protein product [Parnassius mnemosyne]|uniref:DNA helicase MCM9 n=1 Tax=Parnassius mnemosyne TaxID=213953 RepID=A0AAV1KC03_9NEOP